jgi:hypothetical protein
MGGKHETFLIIVDYNRPSQTAARDNFQLDSIFLCYLSNNFLKMRKFEYNFEKFLLKISITRKMLDKNLALARKKSLRRPGL